MGIKFTKLKWKWQETVHTVSFFLVVLFFFGIGIAAIVDHVRVFTKTTASVIDLELFFLWYVILGAVLIFFYFIAFILYIVHLYKKKTPATYIAFIITVAFIVMILFAFGVAYLAMFRNQFSNTDFVFTNAVTMNAASQQKLIEWKNVLNHFSYNLIFILPFGFLLLIPSSFISIKYKPNENENKNDNYSSVNLSGTKKKNKKKEKNQLDGIKF